LSRLHRRTLSQLIAKSGVDDASERVPLQFVQILSKLRVLVLHLKVRFRFVFNLSAAALSMIAIGARSLEA
jgi:hypothetical protein